MSMLAIINIIAKSKRRYLLEICEAARRLRLPRQRPIEGGGVRVARASRGENQVLPELFEADTS